MFPHCMVSPAFCLQMHRKEHIVVRIRVRLLVERVVLEIVVLFQYPHTCAVPLMVDKVAVL